MKMALAITGAGSLSPVGHSTLEAMHSVRSGVTRLSLQRFPDRAKQWIAGGNCMTWNRYAGARYLEALADEAFDQAWTQAQTSAAAPLSGPLGLILGAPDAKRPGFSFPPPGLDLSEWASRKADGRFAYHEVIAAGACSMQMALHRARELITAGRVEACLIGAADSQLQLRVVRWHEQHYRLKCSYLSDGLMPAEAAAFLVVEAEQGAAARGAMVLARVLSSAIAKEEAGVLTDRPNSAAALTAAVRTALADADVSADEIGMVWSDLNGESYRAREWAFAEIRAGFQTGSELMHPADCHGDLGAASDAHLLGMVAMCHATGWSGRKPLLLFTGSDDGLRGATVLGAGPTGGSLPQVSGDLPRIYSTRYAVGEAPSGRDEIASSNDPPRAYFRWQLREEHRDEIASLYYQRRALLRASDLPWTRLLTTERRTLRHLDAAVAGGAASMGAVLAGIQSEEEGLCYAAALLAGALPERANFARIEAALGDLAARSAGCGAALAQVPPSQELERFVLRCLDHAVPAVQAMALRIAFKQQIDVAEHLGRLLSSPDASVLAQAAAASRRFAATSHARRLSELLEYPAAPVRRQALLALLCFVPERTLAYSRARLRSDSAYDGALALVVGMNGASVDADALIAQAAGSDQPAAVAAIDALGLLGAPAAFDALVAQLVNGGEAAKVSAWQALLRIFAARKPDAASLPAHDFPGAAPEEARVAACRDWWAQHRSRFDPARRHRRGEPFALLTCIDEMADADSTLVVRQTAALELQMRSRVAIAYEADWFVVRQQAAIESWRAWACDAQTR